MIPIYIFESFLETVVKWNEPFKQTEPLPSAPYDRKPICHATLQHVKKWVHYTIFENSWAAVTLLVDCISHMSNIISWRQICRRLVSVSIHPLNIFTMFDLIFKTDVNIHPHSEVIDMHMWHFICKGYFPAVSWQEMVDSLTQTHIKDFYSAIMNHSDLSRLRLNKSAMSTLRFWFHCVRWMERKINALGYQKPFRKSL